MSDAQETPASDLHRFAAALAHEIRTPLTAITGEVEVALRRDRSAAEYREVLRRIAVCVSELVAISGDLTLLSDPVDASSDASTSARLDAILTQIQNRYAGNAGIRVAVDHAEAVRVPGDEARLGRAITLVVEHAMRHRRENACVFVRAAAIPNGRIRIVIDAQPPGFWPHAWSSLGVDAAGAASPLRLRTARRILIESGGVLLVADSASGAQGVHIELHAFA